MDRTRWKKIEEARKLLGLPRETTRAEIRAAYRRLAAKYHPDREGSEERMKALNEAYRILMDYCEHYRIDLSPNERGADAAEWWFLHFGEDPVWAGKRGE